MTNGFISIGTLIKKYCLPFICHKEDEDGGEEVRKQFKPIGDIITQFSGLY